MWGRSCWRFDLRRAVDKLEHRRAGGETGPSAAGWGSEVGAFHPPWGDIEPAHAEGVEPWWRVVDTTAREPAADTPAPMTLPKAMPWPID